MIIVRVVVAGLLLAVAAPSSAEAATPGSSVRTAFWWVPEPVTGLIPAPGVPAKGLYVASSPSGTQAMSALSITTPIRSGLVRLTLRVAQRQVINPPAITAYAVASSWQSGGPQPWSSRPKYATALGSGSFNMTQTQMSLRIPAVALSHGIVLVPTTKKGATLAPTFAVSFQPPVAAAVRPSTAPTTSPTLHPTPTSSKSGRPSHHPTSSTPTPTHSRRHHPTPSAHPRHTPHSGTPTPTPPVATSAPPTAVTATDSSSSHGGLIAILIAAVLAVATAATVGWRRLRRSAPPG